MKLDTLRTLYVDELRDLYNAENQLLKALPKMAKGATSEELRDAFEKHLEQTKTHVERLEEVFEDVGEKPKSKTCKAMKGLIEEGSEILNEDGEESEANELLNKLAEDIVNPEALMEPEMAGASSER